MTTPPIAPRPAPVAPLGMRAALAPVLADAVAADPALITVGADGRALFGQVIERYPRRYVDVGIAEGNLVGVAAGLARAGLRPVAAAMAPFLVRRAYEQIRLDVGLPGLPVVLLGVGGGLGYGPLGPTHHATDDITLMSAVPGMEVYCPADAADAVHALRTVLAGTSGPAYVRLSARTDPVLPQAASAGDPRAPRLLRDGDDVLVLATGRCVAEALDAADELAADGVAAAVASVTALRPFPAAAVRELADRRPLVVTVAESLPADGLGPCTAEALGRRGPALISLHTDHRYPPVAAHQELLRFYGVDGRGIRSAVLSHRNRKTREA
ncbi:transketolase C-terminal domain-containing protein [Streptomyces longwoodensis]|uniref:Amc3b n=1 Tax=Streptomyces novoguineensis TaxID=2586640 RepID=A0A4Y5QSA8_9ACTN|nr:Amc3b [Streptomyces novoguineensis]QHW08559.1 transketolase [Streptomyces novoguineensis]BBE52680.1 transketolase C-terminal domain containing protein [Streptomyces sp.]